MMIVCATACICCFICCNFTCCKGRCLAAKCVVSGGGFSWCHHTHRGPTLICSRSTPDDCLENKHSEKTNTSCIFILKHTIRDSQAIKYVRSWGGNGTHSKTWKLINKLEYLQMCVFAKCFGNIWTWIHFHENVLKFDTPQKTVVTTLWNWND